MANLETKQIEKREIFQNIHKNRLKILLKSNKFKAISIPYKTLKPKK